MKNLVWLTSYPRSGNTWFRVFLSGLLADNHHKTDINHLATGLIANSRIMFDEFTGINSSDLTSAEIDNLKPAVYQLLSGETHEYIYLKTHDKYLINNSGNPVFPASNTYGCVYIIRNPLDVAVSNAFYFKKSFDEVIEFMNKGNLILNFRPGVFYPLLDEKPGNWSQHVTSWMNSGFKIHVIRYEDMLNHSFDTFRKAVEFLGLEASDQKVLDSISDSSIQKLKKLEETGGFREKLQGGGIFFRNGKSGSWKTNLTENQITKIISEHGEVMKRFDYMTNDGKIIEQTK